ncbi:hypothetical protein K9U40_06490 [Xanthobacter autotrophicus]|uniref:hypothetical protein n=1 Tax=Xanthobacter TaxID=279 RepID=UPI0024ABEF2B|nr:hypothetical protein [Xanthobacter autotrophicus]MDI4663976.1 hypothetical protein [Xanthobacter autotrophicus]
MWHKIAGLTALARLTAAMAVTPARADTAKRSDGYWVVRTSAEAGKCNKNFNFKLAVKNGKVTCAGYWPVKASGGISKLGLVRMTLVHGQRKVTATGLAEGDQASDDWSSPLPNCTGSWFARRA